MGLITAVSIYNYRVPIISGFVPKEIQAETSDTEIYFKPEVVDQLNWLYYIFDSEYAICLYGGEREGKIYIYSLDDAFVTEADESYALRYACKGNVLIDMHNHKDGICVLSEQDIEALESWVDNKDYDKDIIMGVQCGQNQFAFFRYKQYDTKLKWEIYQKG